jgi:hypothetical protein
MKKNIPSLFRYFSVGGVMKAYVKPALCFAMCCVFLHNTSLVGESATADSYKEVQWDELVPESWNPEKAFEGLDLDSLPEDDYNPRVEKAYEAFMEEWAKAPANEKISGQRIKISGFIAPLDWENDAELKEFLLVPYFGACIHLPPPPANQIIHVKTQKPLKGLRSMDAAWVYGTISVERHDSGSMGASGYSMALDKAEPYQW